MKKTDPPVVVSVELATDRPNVWDAITNRDRMVQWFFDNIPEFKPEVGFETQFVVQPAERAFTHLWKITEVIPLAKITYHWSYLEYPGEGEVIFELTETQGGTTLKLTNGILSDFPEDVPEFNWEACEGGWNYFLRDRLASYLR